jgi:hypothetical protein
MLEGFGDKESGEWTEDRPKAFHLRRRLSATEQERIGQAVDCRGTDEGRSRFEAIVAELPIPALLLADQELREPRP